jgi:hypothetical protein
MIKATLRLLSDNRSVARAVIQFPDQKLLSFCSIFPHFLPPQNLRQPLNAAGEVTTKSAEW